MELLAFQQYNKIVRQNYQFACVLHFFHLLGNILNGDDDDDASFCKYVMF